MQPEHLNKLTSIASIQTKGLKKHFLEQERGDTKKQKHRDDENEEEMQRINSISGSQKHNRLLMLGIDVNNTTEENDPSVVGFEVRCLFKHPLNIPASVWNHWITVVLTGEHTRFPQSTLPAWLGLFILDSISWRMCLQYA
jgi:hypothetical protein